MAVETVEKIEPTISSDVNFKWKIIWPYVILHVVVHIAAIYGLFHFVWHGNWVTLLWAVFMINVSVQGVTLGAHRLYAHKSYKAHFSIRLLLNIMHVTSGQLSMFTWALEHRQHHMYTDTNADPHSSERGFFFAHMGWLMIRKHPDALAKRKTIDVSDIKADPIVMFQKKYYLPLYFVFALLLPVAVPIYFWNETFIASFCLAYGLRYAISLHIIFLVNSAAHMYGTRPYDKNIKPAESLLVSVLSNGEGWHNYHHTFPWDYRASEFGTKVNISTYILDMLAYLGLVYDLRTPSKQVVQQRIERTGDGTKTK